MNIFAAWTYNNDMVSHVDASSSKLGQNISSTFGYGTKKEQPLIAAEDMASYGKNDN